MADIFLQDDITRLLDNRFIVIIGDSIQRAVYKDLVLLLQRNRYLTDGNLRSKGEFTFCGDKLIEGGQYGEMSNGVKYREVRQYHTDYHLVRFYFVTRCYNAYMESILSDICQDPIPDVILMNSCLWDISRYGPNSVEEYKENLSTLFQRFNEVLPKSCLVIWNTTLPISKKARGGFLIPAVEFMNNTLRLDILEANFYTHKLACVSGINVLDLHYFLRHQLQRRAGDGVHWDMTAHRRMTNLILTHIAQAWNVKLPENAKKILLREQMDRQQMDPGVTQFNNNMLDENSNSFNMNSQGSHGLYDNPSFFKQAINQFNLPNTHNSAYTQKQVYPVSNRNMNNINSNLMARQQEALLQSRCPGLLPAPDAIQRDNINRYGGPIRAPAYMGSNAGNQMIMMEGQQCVSQLNWEPYRNEQLNVNMRYGNEQRPRELPYKNCRGRKKYRYR